LKGRQKPAVIDARELGALLWSCLINGFFPLTLAVILIEL
jgi:hypothetical protein